MTHITCRVGVCCHLDTDNAACRQGNGLIPVRKVTLTVLQEQGSMPLMDQFGLQCFLQPCLVPIMLNKKYGAVSHHAAALSLTTMYLTFLFTMTCTTNSSHGMLSLSLHSAIHTNRKHLQKPANTVRRRDEAKATLHQLCRVAQDCSKWRGPAGSSFHACMHAETP